MNWPSLSIIIPSFNQGQYIERTILSILKQGYKGALQVIVSDGGSTDETVEVLKKYPELVWWSKPDKGFADAVNQGLAVATGEIVAIQSSDDYYLKDAFNTAIPALVEKPEVAFVTGADLSIYQDGSIMWIRPISSKIMANPDDLLIDRGISQHCTFVRRSAIDRVDGLRSIVDRCADFDLWYRILHFYPGLVLPYHFAAYQKHPEQRGQNKAQAWIDSFRVVVDTCKKDEKYAREFVPSEKEWQDFDKAMELTWNFSGGGDEGVEISKRMAREVLEDESRWSENLRRQARSILGEPEPVQLSVALKKFGIRTRLRQLVGNSDKSAAPILDQEAAKARIDLDWWKKS